MAAGKVNTMSEALQSIAQVINSAKQLQDANLPFLVQLETLVLQEIRSPQRIMQEQGLLPPDGAGGPQAQGMPPGPGGGAPSFMPPGGGDSAQAGLRGMTPGPAAPNMDEMRRMLQ